MRNRRSETRKGQANARKLCHVGTRYELLVLRPIRPPKELYEMHFWGKQAGSVSLSISSITRVQRRFAQVLTPYSSELCRLSRVGWLGHPMPQRWKSPGRNWEESGVPRWSTVRLHLPTPGVSPHGTDCSVCGSRKRWVWKNLEWHKRSVQHIVFGQCLLK